MRTKVGLWIDHRKAIVVAISDKGEQLSLTISGVEKQLRRTGEAPRGGRFEYQRVIADDSRQEIFTRHINHYYDAVIASLGAAESILIFGPGEAKGELKKRLKKAKLDGRIVGVEAADKMTPNQIAAKVRKSFAK